MKKHYELFWMSLGAIPLVCLPSKTSAQISNNEINAGIIPYQIFYDGVNDGNNNSAVKMHLLNSIISMKSYRIQIMFGILFSTFYSCSVLAQISNDNINLSMKPYIIYYDGVADPVANMPAEGNFTANITYEISGLSNLGMCYAYSIPSTPDYHMVGDYTWGYKLDMPYVEMASLYFSCWEDDSASCEYNAGDDDLISGGVATFDWGWNPPTCTFSGLGDYKPSYWRYAQNPVENNWLYTVSDLWDLQVGTSWRYNHGETCADPLIFGSIPTNTTVSHKNSTSVSMLSETPSAEGILTYLNDADGDSPDVYYSFTIAQPMEVTITTYSSYSNFDTYLRLFSLCNTLIAQNDDMPTSNKSEIVVSLYPGTYYIQVEGFDVANGDFELIVSTGSSLVELTDINQESNTFEIYPNPAIDFINVRLGSAFTAPTIQVLNMLGQSVYKETFLNNGVLEIPVHELASGSYLIVVEEDTKPITKLFTIK